MSTPGVFPAGAGPIIHQLSGNAPWSRNRAGEDTFNLRYLVKDPQRPNLSHLQAEAELFADTGGSFDHIPDLIGDARLESYTWSEKERGVYVFDLKYDARRLEPDEYEISVDTTGGSVTITNSFGTDRYAAPLKTAPDFQSSIDVKDGKPQGVDRVIPTTRIDIRYRLTRPADPIAWVNTAGALTGTVNNNAMLGRVAGELLFLGFSGRFPRSGDPELNFSWALSPNATISIGNVAGVAKRGHDYLWILYEEAKVGSGADAYRISRPRAAYVEKIYTEADHSALGLLL